MTTRYICTTCAHITHTDDDEATGRPCIDCLRGWASRTTSPAGRYAAQRLGIDLPEAAAYCQHPVSPHTTGKPTGIPLVDNGGARICPNIANDADHLCAFHRTGGTIETRRIALIESLF